MKPATLAKRLGGQAFQAMREDLMDRVLYTVLGKSQRLTPVKTGTLRRSETTRQEAKGTRGFIGTNIVYGAFVHEGTKYMTARPFFREGIEDSRAEIDRVLEKAGNTFFDRVAKG